MPVDLDAARKQREAANREAKKLGPVVILDKKKYTLPIEMPYEVLEALRGLRGDDAAGALADVCEALLVPEVYTKFKESRPSIDDMQVLVKGVMEEYGVDSPLE